MTKSTRGLTFRGDDGEPLLILETVVQPNPDRVAVIVEQFAAHPVALTGEHVEELYELTRHVLEGRVIAFCGFRWYVDGAGEKVCCLEREHLITYGGPQPITHVAADGTAYVL